MAISEYRGNIRFWLKGYLFVGVGVLILAMLIYSNHLISRMQEHSEASTRLFSRFVENVDFEIDDEGRLALLLEVLNDVNLPIIITVYDGIPIAWRRVPVGDMEEEDFEQIQRMDVNNPPPGKLTTLVELAREFDRINEPVRTRIRGGGDDINGMIHFGRSKLQKELRYMPFIQLGLFFIFMGVAIQGLRYLKLSEERSIWVGMAKETAHQLGTPISALMGWMQLFRDRVDTGRYEDLGPALNEMEVDLNRLGKVTERFSKIGAQPELKEVSVKPVLEHTVAYFHKRLPRLKANSAIALDVADDLPSVKANEELFEWVLENLIKNGLDALGEGGRIQIAARHDSPRRSVEIAVRDTGKGIPSAMRERIFRPGFTTKKRGWGLGLALTRRIVEEYHGGSLKLAESRPGKGTTFVVRLPVA